jgi:hypothetical protein
MPLAACMAASRSSRSIRQQRRVGVRFGANGALTLIEGPMVAFGDYLAQLLECIQAKLWYPALALALALPDICADLEGVPGNYEQRVITWLTQNRTFLAIEPAILYSLRCAFLHRRSGILGDRKKPRGRVVLLDAPMDGLYGASMRPDGTQFGEYQLEVDDVIRCLHNAAGRWAQEHLELLEQSEATGRLLKILPNPRNEPIARRLRQKGATD